MNKKKILIILLIIVILLSLILGTIIIHNNNTYKGKKPMLITIYKGNGGTPYSIKYKINMKTKELKLIGWEVEKGDYKKTYSLTDKDVTKINNLFKKYGINNYEKESDELVAGGIGYDLNVTFYDSSKVSIHTYGSKVYIKGDNKKLFDELYNFVKKKFD